MAEIAEALSDAGRTSTAIHDILPPEILVKIFHCLKSETPWARPRLKEAPLLVCRICSAWRTTALAAPDLWDTLVVTFRDPAAVPATMAGARTWLSRAKSRKLSLWVYFFHSISANPIAELVAHHDGHIGVLRLTSAPIGCLQSLFDFPADSFPVLRSLTVESPPAHFSWARKLGNAPAPPLFPQLEQLSVSAGWRILDIAPTPIAWARLTSLAIHKAGVTLPALCALLARCIALERCVLEVREAPLPDPDPPALAPAPIALPRLTTLHLQLAHASDLDYLLTRLAFPALATAVLALSPDPSAQPQSPPQRLPALASPALRRLALRIPCAPAAVLALLARAPALTELHVPCHPEIVRALAEVPSLAPALASLTCILAPGGDRAAEGLALVERPAVRVLSVLPGASEGWAAADDLWFSGD